LASVALAVVAALEPPVQDRAMSARETTLREGSRLNGPCAHQPAPHPLGSGAAPAMFARV
jgi:hypothetical protein